MPTKNSTEIDYLHPNGKPAVQEEPKSQEEIALESASRQKSIDEADGHHMCSDRCKLEHKNSS
jgi:hypothetical protein